MMCQICRMLTQSFIYIPSSRFWQLQCNWRSVFPFDRKSSGPLTTTCLFLTGCLWQCFVMKWGVCFLISIIPLYISFSVVYLFAWLFTMVNATTNINSSFFVRHLKNPLRIVHKSRSLFPMPFLRPPSSLSVLSLLPYSMKDRLPLTEMDRIYGRPLIRII